MRLWWRLRSRLLYRRVHVPPRSCPVCGLDVWWSTRRNRSKRDSTVSIYRDRNDWWLGYYRGSEHHYVCVLPTVVVRWERSIPDEVRRRLSPVMSDEEIRLWWRAGNGYLDGPSPAEAWPDIELAIQAELQAGAFTTQGEHHE